MHENAVLAKFQPTLPARGATFRHCRRDGHGEISTHAPRTGSDCKRAVPCQHGSISTHAPRTGSDGLGLTGFLLAKDFNPRSPHGERPTPTSSRWKRKNFNPRSPHGERLSRCRSRSPTNAFQPTLPARGATPCSTRHPGTQRISTHAPRTGSDHTCRTRHPRCAVISTHAPRTGSDPCGHHGGRNQAISTHAPRTGSDGHKVKRVTPRRKFQPTLPARGATPSQRRMHDSDVYFNPRSPHGERLGVCDGFGARDISTHAPRTGSDYRQQNNRQRHP